MLTHANQVEPECIDYSIDHVDGRMGWLSIENCECTTQQRLPAVNIGAPFDFSRGGINPRLRIPTLHDDTSRFVDELLVVPAHRLQKYH